MNKRGMGLVFRGKHREGGRVARGGEKEQRKKGEEKRKKKSRCYPAGGRRRARLFSIAK